MKILNCIPTLEIGGEQRQISYLAPALAALGHDVHVFFLEGGPNLPQLESHGVVLHRIRSWGNHDPGIFFQLLGLIHRIKPDIIQTWILQMDVLGGISAELTGTPWVLREPSVAAAYKSTTKNLVRQWIGRCADAVLPNSKGGESYWRALDNPQFCRVIPNGIPLDLLESEPPASPSIFGLSPEQKVVLYVGRFDKGKNIDSLLSALTMIPNGETVVAILVGDGLAKPAILRAIDRLGISDRVIIPGFMPNPWPLMKRADVFAFLSLFEGQPNVVLEAMACGCPLVVSDIPAHREFLDERCALLVDPGRPAEIAEALRDTMIDSTNAQCRAKIAKEKVTRWSVAWVARQYEEAYREVLERRLCRQ